jgi:hypothetical protein
VNNHVLLLLHFKLACNVNCNSFFIFYVFMLYVLEFEPPFCQGHA